MEILNKYPYANKYYAKIQDEDGSILELSSSDELTDEQWEQLYEQVKSEQTEYELEAEDGETV
jgi:hypothetical protein